MGIYCCHGSLTSQLLLEFPWHSLKLEGSIIGFISVLWKSSSMVLTKLSRLHHQCASHCPGHFWKNTAFSNAFCLNYQQNKPEKNVRQLKKKIDFGVPVFHYCGSNPKNILINLLCKSTQSMAWWEIWELININLEEKLLYDMI